MWRKSSEENAQSEIPDAYGVRERRRNKPWRGVSREMSGRRAPGVVMLLEMRVRVY